MPLPDPVERAGNVVAPAGFGVLELLLGGLAALGPLSIDMYLPALPDIGKDFGVLTADVQFSLASFFVGFAAAQLIAGPLVDRYGRRRPLLLALALYVLASLGCAAATSNDWLIFFRLLEGLAGSVAVVVPRAVVRDLHSGAAAVHMLSRLMLVMGVAPIVAPLLGTWVLAGFGWRAIFVFLAGFGALAMLACLRLLPETGRPRDPTATLGNDLRVLAREPDFRAYTLCGGFSSAGMFAYIVGSAFVFQEVHGVSADEYSYFFGANAFGLIAASQLNRVLVGRFTAVQVLGAATSLAATAALALLDQGAPDLVLSDIDMPQMSGFDLVRHIRLRFRSLPIVMLSARSSDDDRRRATAAGADAYLVKSSFNTSALLDAVSRFLGPRG